MSHAICLPIFTACVLSLAGCAQSTPHPDLIEARELFTQLQNKPESFTLVVSEVREAFAVLIKADLLSNTDIDSPEVSRLSQLAMHKIALAEQAIATRKPERLINRQRQTQCKPIYCTP
ncbi:MULTISPECIES: hypothetical protein [unclassified Pseudomonas]|uniref:hypothetical protein n=1 Tax=unclassified Pseudomonas TaxID=196821 RepID=UPI000F5626C0|nr:MULTISPECIES: hypothetical protein [unclassified Pseudomonas]AZF49637.1 hypothetical protein C4J86_4433 [Pseudomonas sp. R2-7-07]